MWDSSILLWKSGKQSVVTASTAESEMVEILEGALAGDAVRVVLEEALDVKARAVSFTDNTASVAIVTGAVDHGEHKASKKNVPTSFEPKSFKETGFFLMHRPGSELPADLGTKVLSQEKFKRLKVLMGMLLNENAEKKRTGDFKE